MILPKLIVKKNIKNLLIFHEIGSGKTCTGIRIAFEIFKNNKNYKIFFISPSGLLDNSNKE